MKKIEILAPAGSYESLMAAVNAECDAVYIGGSKFGARAFANNLTEEQLLGAIDYVHLHGKNLYLTVNTILKNKELEEELYTYLLKYYEQGLDAVIVQDLGVMNFIHKNFPDLPIHASTQMTLTMAEGLEVFKNMGVTRLVTSRELSLSEISNIRKNTNLEIESFVHGALCYCYSGQCFMSSMLGGRSGNRGRCAQTCRMPFKVTKDGKTISKEEEKYVLSPKDICTLNIIPDLIEAGIDSFKIEGRMKKPEYTAMVAHLYRKYVDLYLNLGREQYDIYIKSHKKEFDEDVRRLMDLYNRGGFTEGYYNSHNGRNMMANKRPNHSGVLVGEVVSVKGNNAAIKLKEDVNGQDILEIRSGEESIYEFTLKDSSGKGSVIRTNFMVKAPVKVGNLVYRTRNDKLLQEIQEHYLKDAMKEKIEGKFIGKLGQEMSLTFCCKDNEVTVKGDVVEPAMKQPMTKEKISQQLNKMNSTSFVINELELDIDDQIFIPVVKLNELRREATGKLVEKIVSTYRREKVNHQIISARANVKVNRSNKKVDDSNDDRLNQNLQCYKENSCENRPGIAVHVLDSTMVEEVLGYQEVRSIYLDTSGIEFEEISGIVSKVRKAKKDFYLVLPHVFRKETYEDFLQYTELLQDEGITGFVIKNLEEYNFVMKDLNCKELNKQIILDYNVYTVNQEAKEFWQNREIHHFTTSIELNASEIKELGCEDSDLLVYGHIPLMVSAQCVLKNTKGCLKKNEVLNLTDRKNKTFYVKNYCKYCYNCIYNGEPISLIKNKKEILALHPRNLRLDFTFENSKEIHEIIEAYINTFVNDQDVAFELKSYTRGHFKRGIE